LENGDDLVLDPAATAAAYREKFAAHRRALAELCADHGLAALPLRTDEPPLDALRAYLARRAGQYPPPVSFLSPNFLLAVAALALPLLLHLLRRRVTRTIPFPSLRFLAAAKPTDRRRQNLRRRIVLALRCLALVALALAFARPFFGAAEPPVGRATVIIVDNSYSLQTGQR